MKITNVIVTKLYPLIEKSMNSNMTKYKSAISKYVTRHNKELYDICPASRIFYTNKDREELLSALQLDEKDVEKILHECYYWQIPNFNPRAVKDPLTIILLCIVRYFFIKKKEKELELSSIYLVFSPKIYASIHIGSCRKFSPDESPANRATMEYVVNNILSNKYDIKKYGSVFGAVRSICLTWLDKYKDKLKTFDDEDVVYLIQQLHDRVKSMIHNIMEEYYAALEKGDMLMLYTSDTFEDDNFRLADNDSLRIERYVEKSMSRIINKSIDYNICRMVSDVNVKTDELKDIIETIISDRDNIPIIKEFIRLVISTYFNEPNSTKDVRDIAFITSSIKSKPNTKSAEIIKSKKIIENFLNDNSPAYRKRKSRLATKSSYEKSVATYFILLIHESCK